MAYTYKVSTSIEINASPEVVRSTLLDFPSIPQWASAHIRSIQVLDSGAAATTTPPSVDGPAEGSKLNVELKGMSFKPVVVTNTKSEFAWLGQLLIPKIFLDGRHSFVFNAREGGKKTELVQSEEFQGVLCSLMKWTSMGQDTTNGFQAFNEELKKRSEEIAAGRK